jgi:beta-glucanase (GH16 family)
VRGVVSLIVLPASLGLTALAVLSPVASLTPVDALPAAPEGQEWRIVFQDEFDGETLDPEKWDVPEGQRRGGWWSAKAISVDGEGHLRMSVLREGDRVLDGCIRTRGHFEHAFGYYVTRVKLQSQPGHWSAFWLYNDCVGSEENEGRDGTEIDVFEKPWLDDRVQHTLHWDGYGEKHKSEGRTPEIPGIMDGWHTFGLWWTPSEYIFYVDGEATWRTNAGGVCQVPLYLKLSDEVGEWAGDIAKAKLPDEWLVDYVRVYDLAPVEK